MTVSQGWGGGHCVMGPPLGVEGGVPGAQSHGLICWWLCQAGSRRRIVFGEREVSLEKQEPDAHERESSVGQDVPGPCHKAGPVHSRI